MRRRDVTGLGRGEREGAIDVFFSSCGKLASIYISIYIFLCIYILYLGLHINVIT